MIKIAIATNINFYEKTLPIIIESLLNCGIEKKDIYIFNSGFNESEFFIDNGIPHYRLNYHCFEYAPFIEIVEKNILSEYWFLIHDTCKVGSRFKELLYNIPENRPEKLALRSKPCMAIGSYKYDYLIKNKDLILSLKNTDYSESSMTHWKNWTVNNEDFLLWMTEPQPIIYNNIDSLQVVDYNSWYGEGVPRRTEYYPSLDLYKNKSNWGQSSNLTIKL